MKSRISKDEAKAFKKRWEAVNEAEREELRATSPEQKVRQLVALMISAEQFGWTESLASEEAEVRDRWIKIRKAYGV